MKLTRFAKRNREREKPFGAFFNQTSSQLLVIQQLFISLFLTPVLIASSILSKDIIIMIANILLSLSYLSNLIYRIYHRQVSNTELLITAICLTALVAITVYFAPAFGLVGALAVLAKINLVATSINGFFLIKNLVVPPCKKWVDKLMLKMGIISQHDYYQQPSLRLGKDDFAINQLLETNYKSDISSVTDNDDSRLQGFNRLIKILSQYMNKYYVQFLGNVRRSSDLTSLEAKISDTVTKGRAGGAYGFIHEKLSFKRTKLIKLKKAREVIAEQKNESSPDKRTLKQYINFTNKEFNSPNFFDKALELLDGEITRQEQKKETLESCLPQATMSL